MLFRFTFVVFTLMFQLTAFAQRPKDISGAIYTSTNSPEGNSVVILNRHADGTLTPGGLVSTGGLGTGSGLSNQNGIVLSDDHRWLLIVNAGSDDISVFAVRHDGLRLMDVEPSNGDRPVSIAVHQSLVYVVNAGDSNNISGFRLEKNGQLTSIPGSSRPLSGPVAGPAQIAFNPEGDTLLVTERLTSLIDVYTVGSDGLVQGPTVYPSSGLTPFGFAFGKRDQVFVSEAFAGLDASATSSYTLSEGILSVISPSVPTTETAACWVVVSSDGRFAYAANAGSESISGYRVSLDGELELLDADGRTGTTSGGGPTDMAMSQNGRYLYALQGDAGQVAAFRVEADGSLTPITGIAGLSGGLNGLAAR